MAPSRNRTKLTPLREELLPPEAVTVIRLTPGDPASLYPEESSVIARALPKRAREFAAGRQCARLALEVLGEPPVAIPVNADRSPAWPAGMVGSISHRGACCAAAVAYQKHIGSLGIDVETDTSLDAKLVATILTEREIHRIGTLGIYDRLLWAKIAFSAKESLYKCYRPVTGQFLGFQDVDVEILPAERRFRVRLVHPDRPDALGTRTFDGRYTLEHGYIFTAVSLPPARRTSNGPNAG